MAAILISTLVELYRVFWDFSLYFGFAAFFGIEHIFNHFTQICRSTNKKKMDEIMLYHPKYKPSCFWEAKLLDLICSVFIY